MHKVLVEVYAFETAESLFLAHLAVINRTCCMGRQTTAVLLGIFRKSNHRSLWHCALQELARAKFNAAWVATVEMLLKIENDGTQPRHDATQPL
eukprot:3815503-Amphidinium_carterae.1